LNANRSQMELDVVLQMTNPCGCSVKNRKWISWIYSRYPWFWVTRETIIHNNQTTILDNIQQHEKHWKWLTDAFLEAG
jgi:hypothetical protein